MAVSYAACTASIANKLNSTLSLLLRKIRQLQVLIETI